MNEWLILLIVISIFALISPVKRLSSLGPALAFLFALGLFGIIFFYTFNEFDRPQATVPREKEPAAEVDFIKIKEKVLLDVPVIKQLPELPRGCEVTALAMLLKSAGAEADKMKLAKEVKRNPAQHIVKNGKVHFGNPHNGFVGDMYTFEKPGLGVYHEPIFELGNKYLPGRLVNLTGDSFDELKIPLSDGKPVWVIINAEYRQLPDSYFEIWETESGPIKITMKEHSVVLTGYDKKYIYFNDPLTGKKNKKAPIGDFEKSWVQMGSQALTYK